MKIFTNGELEVLRLIWTTLNSATGDEEIDRPGVLLHFSLLSSVKIATRYLAETNYALEKVVRFLTSHLKTFSKEVWLTQYSEFLFFNFNDIKNTKNGVSSLTYGIFMTLT